MMIDTLIPVISTGRYHEPTYCNARDLHQALKVGRVFAAWIAGRIKKYGFVDGVDFFPVWEKSSGGRRPIDYRLTLNMAKELAMVENNEIGRNVRRYFIRVEEEKRAELLEMASHALPLPGVSGRARDGLRLKETLVLQRQSSEQAAQLADETRPAVRRNLWRALKQINDALGIPTDPLELP